MSAEFAVASVELDLPPLVAAFARRLHGAGIPVTAERSARLAQALALAPPISRRRLYFTARAVMVADHAHQRAFDAVFAEVFGAHAAPAPAPGEELSTRQAPPGSEPPPGDTARGGGDRHERGSSAALAAASRGPEQPVSDDVPVPMLASDEEVLRDKRFDSLDPDELVALYRLMARLRVAPPERLTRRARRHRRGERVDMRRTLRGSLRTAGDPIRLARRRRQSVHRRMVTLCDISGSMEPYARVYLQFLACAAGDRHEAFVFATRLTRLTRALRSRNPERAIQRAAATAPDWSSGTRIADALKTFNDRHGRRGMARGAVIVILSDGWERGDPAGVSREMERLARLAYRIVWVNPRAAAKGFAPRAGGMVAALPHCDALVSGHSLGALEQVADAIAASRAIDATPAASWAPPLAPAQEADEEPWASATPTPGSSVAMPSGYGPSRGRTTPGWGLRR